MKGIKFVRRPKQKVEKLPTKKRQYQNKYFKWLFWGLLIVTVSGGYLGFMKASAVSTKNHQLAKQVTKLDKKVQANRLKSVGYSPLLDNFMQTVIQKYINLPKSDDDIQKRNQDLNGYFVEGIKIDDAATDATRQLVSAQAFDVQAVSGVSIAKYLVTYKLQTPHTVEKEVKVKKDKKEVTEKQKTTEMVETTKTALLNLPFEKNGNQYSLLDVPYFSAVPTVKTRGIGLKNTYQNQTEYTGSQHKALVKFTTDFLKKYASSSVKDMAYMMTKPEGLAGQFSYVADETHLYKSGQSFIALTTVTFKDKDSNVAHTEKMTLKIGTVDGNYIVKQLKHYTGGV